MRFETYRTRTPTCPHCLTSLTEDDMMGQEPDVFAMAIEETIEPLKCNYCDKSFWVEGGYKPYYTSAFSEEELQ